MPENSRTGNAGEAYPFEIERKFLIEFPDIAALERMPACRRAQIVQTYLIAPEGEEARVRERREDGRCVYSHTIKRKVSALRRVEIEREIAEAEYLALLALADPACRPIQKTRYCLAHAGQIFEIDVYPFWKDRAVMEIELTREDEEIRFPEMIRVVREVTQDAAYKNRALAEI